MYANSSFKEELFNKAQILTVLADTGPQDYKDAPICVQLVGYRYEDEALLNIAALVDSIVNGSDEMNQSAKI